MTFSLQANYLLLLLPRPLQKNCGGTKCSEHSRAVHSQMKNVEKIRLSYKWNNAYK